MQISPILKLAMTMHSNPGVYALMLGSGVSRSAGIPTGWEVVLDLVRKVAAGMGQGDEAEADPAGWYEGQFGNQPDYSELLNQLAAQPAERMALLRHYFEPTDEDREQGIKSPTPAHRAIAVLVRLGYVRMILTTNFDRLMEVALEEEGITPDVISSDDALQGAMPYVHSACVVVKLHGDYRDIRIKNTPAELADYSEALNTHLDRIFDEFGLVVCGWSASYDTALKNAVLRAPTRRFSMYWMGRGSLTSEARELSDNRRAQEIVIEDANKAFTELQDHLESLADLERTHPDSIDVAVATVKRYLPESRHRIRLYDLINTELEHVYGQISTQRFSVHNTTKTNEEFKVMFQNRMREYEAITEKLRGMAATIAFHDEDQNSYLLTKCIERLCQFENGSGTIALLGLQYYPALLLLYATGISALSAGRYDNLFAALVAPQYNDTSRSIKRPGLYKLNVWEIFAGNSYKLAPVDNAERKHTPANDHLYDLLRLNLKEFLPGAQDYEASFDIFEYLLALAYGDAVKGQQLSGWVPWGRFVWRHLSWHDDIQESPLTAFVADTIGKGNEGPLIQAGFFSSSVTRFQEVVEGVAPSLREVGRKLF